MPLKWPTPAQRCTNCDHPITEHSAGGCWFTLTTGREGRDLVCQCMKEPTDARNR